MTLIGDTRGFLISGINWVAVNASKMLPVPEFERCMFVYHKHFTKFAMDVWRCKGVELNWLKTKILYQLFLSNPDGPHPPLVFLAAFFTKSSRISS